MKQKSWVVIKSILFVFFLWVAPFSFKELKPNHLPQFATLLFTQNRNVPQIDLTQTMNVMNMVKKEDIPYREIDTTERTPVPDDIQQPTSGKSVYIYSTHQGETYADEGNVVKASQVLAKLLRKQGVEVIVEEQDFKKALQEKGLDYNESYFISRNAVNDALVEHGGFDLILDFHRDSVPRENTYLQHNDKKYAKLMCVLGGLGHHLSVIKERAGILFDKSNEQIHGIMKPLLIREAYYNQDMSEKMMLIEVGSDQNTYQEVLNSLDILADAIMASLG